MWVLNVLNLYRKDTNQMKQIQWWKWKQRRNWFCLFLKNPCYDSKIMHVEFWLEVSKVLHLSINPVSWLFTMPELFLPEKAENSLNVKDYFFFQKWLQKHWGILFCIKYDRIMIIYWIKSQKTLKVIFVFWGDIYFWAHVSIFSIKRVSFKMLDFQKKFKMRNNSNRYENFSLID